MKQNIIALLIGSVGATLTLCAYSQTFISPGQSITLGLLVLMLGLLVEAALTSSIDMCSIVFSKACELFIEELVRRSWNMTIQGQRRTLHKEDVTSTVIAMCCYSSPVNTNLLPSRLSHIEEEKVQ
ncbi:hypothetical protein RIF29_19059 [Crotalaria pallida]|uniref:Transcription factor CBF/NF-Y/archaeal histone domain-containing protein n=1 Tax=Crotalaria pallida TaxID=3830 RepID=A0AAN9F3A3_CROPI